MTQVSLEEAQHRFDDLVRMVERGETVTVTVEGRPVFDMVPYRAKGGLNLEVLEEFKRKHGIDRFFGEIPEDFDDPLPGGFSAQTTS